MITVDAEEGQAEAVVRADGELTIEEAAGLKAALMDAGRLHDRVSVDLSGITDIALACIQVLYSARRGTTPGKAVAVTGMSRDLSCFLKDTGFNTTPGA